MKKILVGFYEDDLYKLDEIIKNEKEYWRQKSRNKHIREAVKKYISEYEKR